MKNLIKWTGLLFSLAIISFGVSCQKEKNLKSNKVEVNEEVNQNIDVLELVEMSFKKSSTKEAFENYSKSFRNLDENELMEFNALMAERVIENEGSSRRASTESAVNNSLGYQKKVLDLSMELYGKPYNKISKNELEKIFNKLKNKKEYQVAMDCPAQAFQGTAWKTSNRTGGGDPIGYNERKTPGTSDCDHQFIFNLYRELWYGKTDYAHDKLSYWGGGLACEYYWQHDTSGLLVGDGLVNLYFWSLPHLVSNQLAARG